MKSSYKTLHAPRVGLISWALVFLLFMCFHPLTLQSQTVTIGSGTSTTFNYPITAYYGYSYSQQIYYASEIGTSGTIEKIRFYKSSTGSVSNSSDWTIYMGHTTKTEFTSTTDWIPLSQLTQVFTSNAVNLNTTGWIEFTLSTPFAYNGTDNLVIAVDENQLGYNSANVSWYSFTPGTQYRGLYYRSDGTNPNPASPPPASGWNQLVNQLQIVFLMVQTITSYTTEQITSPALIGQPDQPVVALHIQADGSLSPKTVNSITYNTSGTTNVADLTNAKVYYTTTNTFSTANPYGSAIPSPSGTLTFTGSQALANGDNYFWLAYDISASATEGNLIDGTCPQFTTTEPQTYTPTITDPTGARTLRNPLNGTYTIDNGSPTNVPGGTNYNNWDDALNDLNNLGHSGPVTFNVTAGQTWTKTITGSNYAYYLMNYIGSATNPVVFQKSGTGSNPSLAITGTGGTNDIGMFLYGCDYVTFNGIDIVDAGSSSSDYLEWGYYLQGPADNNCDHVTIQNCTIDLNKNNTNSRGIYSYSNAPTSTANANNNLLIQNNTITDAYNGIYLSGNSTYYDQNNTISGNTITQLGNNLSSSVYGIYANYQNNLTISSNTIQTLSGGASLYGLYSYYNNGTCSFQNNIISNVTGSSSSNIYGIYAYPNSAATTTVSGNQVNSLTGNGSAYGIYVGSGATNHIYSNSIHNVAYTGTGSYIAYGISSSGGATNNIYNNFIYDIKAPGSTGAPGVRALNFGGGITANCYHNTIYLDYTSTSASNQSAALYVTTSPTTLNLQNNIFVNNVDVTTGTRAVAFYKSTTSYTNLPNSNNNNLFYAGTPSTKNLIFYDGTNSAQTLAAMQALLSPRESNSVTENPPFVSSTLPYDLHIISGSSTLVESSGTSTTGISTDFDGDIRQGFPGYTGSGLAPDLGADEFNGVNPSWAPVDLGATALVNPPTTGCYGASETVTVTIKNYGTNTLDFSSTPATVTTNVTGAITQTLSATVNSGTLAPGNTMNVNMSSTLDMTAVGTYTFNASTTISGDGNAANDAMPPANRTVAATYAVPYSVDFDANPATGWTTTGWTIGGGGHGNPNNGLYKNVWSSAPTGQFTMAKVGPIAAGQVLKFDYRIVNYTSYPSTPTPNSPAWGSILIEVSTDCGASFASFQTIDPSNHVSTLDWATKSYDLSTFAGSSVIFRFTATWLAGDYYIDFDNFEVTQPGSPIGWCNLQWPSSATINEGGSETVYGRVWLNGVTNAPGAGPGIQAWIGVSPTNTDPSTWPESAWTAATYNMDYGNNDEWMATIGSNLQAGTYYYATRFRHYAGPFAYGGYNALGGGFWDGTQYVSGVLTVNEVLLTLPYTQDFSGSSLPFKWQEITTAPSNRWSVSSTNNAGGTANEMKATYLSHNGTTRLIVGRFNTTGVSQLDLSFKHFYDDYGAGCTFKVQSSVDGSTWTDEAFSFTSGNGNIGPTTVNTTVVNNLGSATYIAFVIDGNHYQFDYWYIDDVSVSASTPPNKYLDVTVFLEGPFNGTDMNTALQTGGLIPTSQPYNTAPWNYAGTESVASVPANVVDWVLVELRDADVPANATPATKLTGWPKAFFLRNDGKIVDLDGSSLPNIGNPTITNNLFIVVRHRNHLDVLSNSGATLSGNNYTYDFSTGINQAYGGSAGFKQLSATVYGMVSGDADADGAILISDFDGWSIDLGSNSVYIISDTDMDGSVLNSDFDIWSLNLGNSNPVNAPNNGNSNIVYRSWADGKPE